MKIEIEHSSDPIHQKTLACLKESIKVYKKKQLLFRESIPEMKRRKKLLDLDASELKLLNKGAEKLEEHLLQPTNLGIKLKNFHQFKKIILATCEITRSHRSL